MNFRKHFGALALVRLMVFYSVWLAVERVALAATQTKNVFLIVSDGLRWQEVFGGAEESLMNSANGGVKNTNALGKEFWRETPEARRQALFPFIWGEIAQRGQIYGNQKKGSVAKVTNTRRFSYPGYSEMLIGFADPRIDSNDKKPNPNITVFEWLNGRPDIHKRVVVFASWDVFPYIFNVERSGLPVWPAWERKFENKQLSVPPMITALMDDTTPILEGVVLDSFVFEAALDHLKRQHPRVLFLGLGETDEWAHQGRYDLYLNAAQHADHFVRRLWETAQSMSEYRDKTTFIITADHGRGSGLSSWKDHGEKVPESDGIWIAIIGPDTPSLGERSNAQPVTQSQIAPTIAALLDLDFHSANGQAAAPISDLVRRTR
jgi:Metalloenzyme superfamily